MNGRWWGRYARRANPDDDLWVMPKAEDIEALSWMIGYQHGSEHQPLPPVCACGHVFWAHIVTFDPRKVRSWEWSCAVEKWHPTEFPEDCDCIGAGDKAQLLAMFANGLVRERWHGKRRPYA